MGRPAIETFHVQNTNAFRRSESAAELSRVLLDEIEAVIHREGPDTIAMIIAEPVQNAGGCLQPPDGYWPGLRELCDEHGIRGKGALLPGRDADVVVLDPVAPRPYGVENSFMNVDYDLYEGETATASVRHTFSRGTLVYDRGQIVSEPGHGRFVPRTLRSLSGGRR